MKRSSDRRHVGEKCILRVEDGNNQATKIQESRAPSTAISLSTSLSRLVSCSEWTGRPKFPLVLSGKERCPWATCINGPRQQLHISIASSRKRASGRERTHRSDRTEAGSHRRKCFVSRSFYWRSCQKCHSRRLRSRFCCSPLLPLIGGSPSKEPAEERSKHSFGLLEPPIKFAFIPATVSDTSAGGKKNSFCAFNQGSSFQKL